MDTPNWDRLARDCASKRRPLFVWRLSDIRAAVNEGAGAWKVQIEVMRRELDEATARADALCADNARLRAALDEAARYADEQAGPFGGIGLVKVAADIARKIRALKEA